MKPEAVVLLVHLAAFILPASEGSDPFSNTAVGITQEDLKAAKIFQQREEEPPPQSNVGIDDVISGDIADGRPPLQGANVCQRNER